MLKEIETSEKKILLSSLRMMLTRPTPETGTRIPGTGGTRIRSRWMTRTRTIVVTVGSSRKNLTISLISLSTMRIGDIHQLS